jgi:hypothetical protein
MYSLGAQLRCAAQAKLSLSALKVRAAQTEHSRSATLVPSLAMKLPAAQLRYAVHWATSTVVLNVPSAQGLQPRAVVLVPCLETKLPALHCANALHARVFGSSL